jgi:hypothetical protein
MPLQPLRVALFLVFIPTLAATAANLPCEFVSSALVFNGTSAEQAACLLRNVHRFGIVDKAPKAVDPAFASLINARLSIKISSFLDYLHSTGIKEEDIGGSLAEPLSHAGGGDPAMPAARYFVIHDVSTPNYGKEPFPANIDDASWSGNDLGRWRKDTGAHVYINRIGESATARNFSTPWKATKFESEVGSRSKGLFVHVELIQPRRSASPGPAGNDALAPESGFTQAQMERLGVVYVAASLRGGQWLVPSFHAVLDEKIPNGHDDPQNFATDAWIKSVLSLVSRIEHQ